MTWKRTVIILWFMLLAGYLATLERADISAILAAVGGPIGTYIAVKGKGDSS